MSHETIVRMRFGAHLYGTETPESDLDTKSVFLPSGREILLGTAVEATRSLPGGQKTAAQGDDAEAYSLRKYLSLVAQGQTVALDMLFAPEAFYLEAPARAWRLVLERRDRLVSRQSAAFLGYCRNQAQRYSVRGDRIAAASAALALIETEIEARGLRARVNEIADKIEAHVAAHDAHSAVVAILGGSPPTPLAHWKVNERHIPFTETLQTARKIVDGILRQYGQRARRAAEGGGNDWKAMSHAVRVGREAIELLDTGRLTFPRPEAEHLLAIKLGRVAPEIVRQEIEDLVSEVEAAAARSRLPDTVDPGTIEEILLEAYGERVEELLARRKAA